MTKNKNQGKTKIILILILLILAVGLFFVTRLVQKNQENRSKAAVTKSDPNQVCLDVGGSCLNFGKVVSNKSKCSIGKQPGLVWVGTGPNWPCQGHTYFCCVPTTKKDAKCGVRGPNPCLSGKLDETPEDTDTHVKWTCKSVIGGKDANCSQARPKEDAKCSPQINECQPGKSTDLKYTGNKATWNCQGINGGKPDKGCEAEKIGSGYNRIYGESDEKIIENLNKSLTGKLENTGRYFVFYAKKENNDISRDIDRDPYLAAAIAMHESHGAYTCNAKYRNNVGEVSPNGDASYPSIEKGIKAIFSFMGSPSLSRNKILTLHNPPTSSGYTTQQIADMQRVYNTHVGDSIVMQWRNAVTNYYEAIRKGKKISISPPNDCFRN